MPRHDRSYGSYHQPGRKSGSNARKNRTKHGGKYGDKVGSVSSVRRRNAKRKAA